MARQIHKLSDRKAKGRLAPGRHSDGGGLYLNVTETGARSWLFMWRTAGKRREMGLGSFPNVSLADARDKASEARSHVAAARDPIESRDAAKQAKSGRKTFGECAETLLAAKESGWRNEKHRQQWRMTLEVYAKALWSKAIDEVDTEAVLAVLTPIWQTKAETASRLRGRIEAVLDAAKAQGFRTGENPAAWRGHLAHLLPRRQKLTRGHHAALPYRDVPGFLITVQKSELVAALALEFLILTAARSGEVLEAHWDEIDREGRTWLIPARRMKAARPHCVPLCGRALTILDRLAEVRTGDFIFPGQRATKPLSNMALAMMLRRLGISGVTIYGFRSSFRDWAGNETTFPRELAEAALAHIVGDETERAYRRSDALDKRRTLMDAWAAFCGAKPGCKVVALAGHARRQG